MDGNGVSKSCSEFKDDCDDNNVNYDDYDSDNMIYLYRSNV
jgi:hypothetical protein